MEVRQQRGLLPEFLYSSRETVEALQAAGTASSAGRGRGAAAAGFNEVLRRCGRGSSYHNNIASRARDYGKFMIPGASEPGKIPMYSAEFYAACTVGGILSCGITHTAVTPLDIVKCNMQVQHC